MDEPDRLYDQGHAAKLLHDYDLAAIYYAEAAELFRKLGDDEGAAGMQGYGTFRPSWQATWRDKTRQPYARARCNPQSSLRLECNHGLCWVMGVWSRND